MTEHDRTAGRQLEVQEFLSNVCAPVRSGTGHGCLFSLTGRRHLWAAGDRLARLAGEAAGEANIYFALAAFGAKSRTVGSAQSLCAIAIDIDAGPAKVAKHGDSVYPTQSEALAALGAWGRATGALPNILVNSGAGLHGYLVLDAAYLIDEWAAVAKMVKASFAALGLRADAQITADAARVMRLPGTRHENGKTCAAFELHAVRYGLEQLRQLFAQFAPVPTGDTAPAPVRDETPPNALADFGAIVAPGGCAWAARAASAGGPSYGDWINLRALVKHCIDGEALAHEVSKPHPEYDPAATQRKFDSLSGGPPTCERIAAPECKGCPHHA